MKTKKKKKKDKKKKHRNKQINISLNAAICCYVFEPVDGVCLTGINNFHM